MPRRAEYVSGPDERGRIVFFLFWDVDGRERGQIFKTWPDDDQAALLLAEGRVRSIPVPPGDAPCRVNGRCGR